MKTKNKTSMVYYIEPINEIVICTKINLYQILQEMFSFFISDVLFSEAPIEDEIKWSVTLLGEL